MLDQRDSHGGIIVTLELFDKSQKWTKNCIIHTAEKALCCNYGGNTVYWLYIMARNKKQPLLLA